MHTPSLPNLDYFLRPNETPIYPYEKTFTQARFDPLVVLHTSGSTGIPKPVTVTNGTFSCIDAYQLIPSLGGGETIGPSLSRKRLFLAFPLFHAASLCYLLGLGIYCQVTCVLPPPKVPLTAKIVNLVHVHGNVHASALPPSMVVDIYKDPSYLKNLCLIQYLIYAGGSLPEEVGNEISSRTKLIQLNGSTEIGLPPLEPCDSSDWEYVRYSQFAGNDFRPVGVDGLHEHFIVRKEELDLFQGVFSTFPNIEEYSMKDLYEKHPIKPDLWRFRGRQDDVIVFLNAEKLNPVDIERVISAHPTIHSAIVGGHGKFQPCLLLEPVQYPVTMEDKAKLLDDIWFVVERANQNCPSHGRVMKDFILFTKSEKPVLRSAKGTVQRNLTLDLYKTDIEKLYDAIALPNTSPKTLTTANSKHVETLGDTLHKIVLACTWLNKRLTPEADFFDLGLDSLQVVSLTKQINTYLLQSALSMKPIKAQTIYNHSSLRKLETAMVDKNMSTLSKDRLRRMRNTFLQYSLDLPISNVPPQPSLSHGLVILLTGSTGSLGSYLLEVLTSNQSVEKVYCLNRGKDTKQHQTQVHLAKGLSAEFPKTTFLSSDLSDPRLGLEEIMYNDLLKSVTHVVHNAWDVNFNRPFDSFASPYIRSVRHLLYFCSESKNGSRLLFVSTESTVKGQKLDPNTRVPERIVEDWTSAIDMGYAESKFVAENLVAVATRRSALRSIICRVGQIAGPTTEQGIWSKREWIPSLIASSVHLGKLPTSLGARNAVDWIPVDIVAQIIIDVLFAPDATPRVAKRKRSIDSCDFPVKRVAPADSGASNESHDQKSIPEALKTTGEILLEQIQVSGSKDNSGVSSNPKKYIIHAPADQQDNSAEPVQAQLNAAKIPLTDYKDILNGDSEGSLQKITACHIENQTHQKDCNSTNLPRVYHIVNPYTTPWSELVPIFQKSCDSPLESVPYLSWLNALRDSALYSPSCDIITKNPAVRLIDYYEHIGETFLEPQVVLSTDETVKTSPTMATLEVVSEKWVANWMRQWGFSCNNHQPERSFV